MSEYLNVVFNAIRVQSEDQLVHNSEQSDSYAQWRDIRYRNLIRDRVDPLKISYKYRSVMCR